VTLFAYKGPKEMLDISYIKKFCPSTFDNFEFVPSVGASGGTAIIWKSIRFLGHASFQNSYPMRIEFTSLIPGVS
jgi:hypothetical protein